MAKDEQRRARREERERLERERLEREDAEAALRRQRIGYLVAGLLVLATLGVIAFVAASGGEKRPTVEAVERAADRAGCTLLRFPVEGDDHTEDPVAYKTNPPTSGDHHPSPAPDGEYETSPPEEALVHSLEHGRILLQYAPDARDRVRNAVRGVFEDEPDKALVFPNDTEMPYEVAATAWTRVLGCPRYTNRVPAALSTFRDAFRGMGPEDVP